ncbi:MAG TPA: GLPGLI family protein [Mucilaginibacter sp.]|jgi:GLPGLI family protein|nr:GLPGLI family protein [Mucilaginibacter sp.]
MKNKLFTAICLLLFSGSTLFAQTGAHFVTAGTIEYDKTINMFALITRELALNTNNDVFGQKAFDAYKKNHPQIQVVKSTLVFGDNKTLFTPAPAVETPNNFFDMPMAQQNNTTYTDVRASSRISQKTVFEEKFLVTDSTSKIKWKITDETRDIAGYTCRRANGLVLDSIYVVAFYTDQIAAVGGPESFTGLPGMILQLALPHENVSWLATKVTEASVPPPSLVAPKKGKAVTGKEFKDRLKSFTKNWGPYAQGYLKELQL